MEPLQAGPPITNPPFFKPYLFEMLSLIHTPLEKCGVFLSISTANIYIYIYLAYHLTVSFEGMLCFSLLKVYRLCVWGD